MNCPHFAQAVLGPMTPKYAGKVLPCLLIFFSIVNALHLCLEEFNDFGPE